MKNNLFNVLLKDKNVNTYTKILITLNMLAFNNDYYIPSTKLINILKKYDIKIDIRLLRKILEKLYSNRVINLHYLGNKRYFSLNFYNNKKKIEEKKIEEFIIDDEYDWLNEDVCKKD